MCNNNNMDKEELLQFLLRARVKTYAGEGGEVTSALKGAKQLEYREDDFLYRDIYYTGKNNFDGIEAIYHQGVPVWSTVYYGDWSTMTEEELDEILRGALIANANTTRIDQLVEWTKDNFVYKCTGQGSIDEFFGEETITKDSEQVYQFNYRGGIIRS